MCAPVEDQSSELGAAESVLRYLWEVAAAEEVIIMEILFIWTTWRVNEEARCLRITDAILKELL